MEIATGYFAKAKDYAYMGYALVSIAKVAPWFLPKDIHMHILPEIAPSQDVLALKDNPIQYTKRYVAEILSKVDAAVLCAHIQDICRTENTDKAVLLCYEAPKKFCHRHIVAKWLGDFLGRKIGEVEISPARKASDV